MENVKKDTETSDNIEDAFDVWIRRNLGEKNLDDAFTFIFKHIRRLGQLKLKHIACVIKYVGYVVGGVLGTFVIYAIYCGFAHIFDMMTDNTESYHYTFFENALWVTVIISAAVARYSFGFWDEGIKGFTYFIFLITVVEYWDYNFIETFDGNAVSGGICYFLFFVIIPILLIVKHCVATPSSEVKENNESDLIAQSAADP